MNETCDDKWKPLPEKRETETDELIVDSETDLKPTNSRRAQASSDGIQVREGLSDPKKDASLQQGRGKRKSDCQQESKKRLKLKSEPRAESARLRGERGWRDDTEMGNLRLTHHKAHRDTELLISVLQEKIDTLQKEKDAMLAEYQEKKLKLEAWYQEAQAEVELRLRQQREREIDDLAETLQCVICRELFVKATSLNCAHTFCQVCISRWLREKRECPVCRVSVSGRLRATSLDHCVDTVVGQMSEDQQTSRSQLLVARAEEQRKLDEQSAGPSGGSARVTSRRRQGASHSRDGSSRRHSTANFLYRLGRARVSGFMSSLSRVTESLSGASSRLTQEEASSASSPRETRQSLLSATRSRASTSSQNPGESATEQTMPDELSLSSDQTFSSGHTVLTGQALPVRSAEQTSAGQTLLPGQASSVQQTLSTGQPGPARQTIFQVSPVIPARDSGRPNVNALRRQTSLTSHKSHISDRRDDISW